MGIILVKLKSGYQNDFAKAVIRASFWYKGQVGITIVSRYPSGNTLTCIRGQYTKGELTNTLTGGLVRENTEVIVTLNKKSDKEPIDIYTGHTGPQTSLTFQYNSLYPSLNGNMMFTASSDFKAFPMKINESSHLSYARNYLASAVVRDYIKIGDFEKVIGANKEIHNGMQMVFANRSGIYIHNAKSFYVRAGIFVSDTERAQKILSFLSDDPGIPDTPVEVKTFKGYRSDTFHQHIFLAEVNELIYYIHNNVMKNDSIPFSEKEKFVVVKENAYPYLDLMSLKSGKIYSIVLYTLLHQHTPFRIKKLHDNGRKD